MLVIIKDFPGKSFFARFSCSFSNNISVFSHSQQDIDTVLSRLSDTPLTDAFAVELVQRLRDQDRAVMPVLHWLNAQLRALGTSTKEIVAHEHKAQAEANVTVRNIITSMRLMSSIDWQEFFGVVFEEMYTKVMETASVASVSTKSLIVTTPAQC